MNKNLAKSAAIYVGLGALVLVGFQNCSNVAFNDASQMPTSESPTAISGVAVDPLSTASLSLVPDATSVVEGSKVNVTINFQHLVDINYICKDKVSGDLVASGQVTQSDTKVPIKINQDLHCEAVGMNAEDRSIVKAEGDVAVACGNRIKNPTTNRCEDFSCKKVVELQKSQLVNGVPTRTIEGVCYAVKIFDAIANDESTLTKKRDEEVYSRNHGSGPITHHPFAMGTDVIEFKLDGPRTVKVSGGRNAKDPIKVDNFLIFGVYPSSVDPKSDLQSYYKAKGTEDSAILDNGVDTKVVKLHDAFLPVESFGSGGTSTLAPMDITNTVESMKYYTLDIRALDCGGHRELSDIYLLFQ